jgi:two-component sensor histidine kinase
MDLAGVTNNLVNLGIREDQGAEISSRIRVINKFNLLCISYSIPYIILSISLKYYQSASVFFIGLLFYIVSLECNKRTYFTTAKFLILFATNFSVFSLSFFYGFGSGFHLYYFTSPLIVFSLFSFSELKKILFGFVIYLSSIAILIYFNQMGLLENTSLSKNILTLLYSVNVFLALSFCILLVAYFSEFNNRINIELSLSNDELEIKNSLLKAEITERKLSEIKLNTLLKDKEILLSETHHRVKNNLAVVSGMLDLQALMYDDPKIVHILDDSRGRIKTMCLIHESLYKYDSLSQIEFGRYLITLSEEIKKAHCDPSCKIEIALNVAEIYLNVTKAIPCGLLINEVITNCFKHAFKRRREGLILIELKKQDNTCCIIIRDNGSGTEDQLTSNPRSLGITLIDAFAKQLKAEYKFINDNGTTLKLTFDIS